MFRFGLLRRLQRHGRPSARARATGARRTPGRRTPSPRSRRRASSAPTGSSSTCGARPTDGWSWCTTIPHVDGLRADRRARRSRELRAAQPEIPTLAEALDACAGMIVNVEIKCLPWEPDADTPDRVVVRAVVDLVRAQSSVAGLRHHRVVVRSRRGRRVPRVRARDRDRVADERSGRRGGRARSRPSTVTRG